MNSRSSCLHFPSPRICSSFDVSAASDNRFYIDPESIAVGTDGVVRYTLVVRTPSGAENISYEGMRCDTREQKFYAFGRRDGTWVNARTSEWRRIEYQDINRQHGVLYRDFFCFDQPRRDPFAQGRRSIDSSTEFARSTERCAIEHRDTVSLRGACRRMRVRQSRTRLSRWISSGSST